MGAYWEWTEPWYNQTMDQMGGPHLGDLVLDAYDRGGQANLTFPMEFPVLQIECHPAILHFKIEVFTFNGQVVGMFHSELESTGESNASKLGQILLVSSHSHGKLPQGIYPLKMMIFQLILTWFYRSIRFVVPRLRDSLTNLKGKAMSQKQQQILVRTHLAGRNLLRSKYASICMPA